MHITNDESKVDFVSFDAVYPSVGFHRGTSITYPDDYIEKNFGPGVFGFFAFHENELIGVARILSDDCVCAHVAEICVHRNWQRKGVGSALMKAVVNRFSGLAIYAASLVGQEVFFAKMGVVPQPLAIACGWAPDGADWVERGADK